MEQPLQKETKLRKHKKPNQWPRKKGFAQTKVGVTATLKTAL
jgi:hypothetical protein